MSCVIFYNSKENWLVILSYLIMLYTVSSLLITFVFVLVTITGLIFSMA